MMRKKGHVVVTHSSYHNAALGAGVVVTLIDPSVNVRGIILRGGSVVTDCASGAGGLLAKASAPASIADGLCVATTRFWTGNIYSHDVLQDVFLPAGMGLYFYPQAAETTSRVKRVAYEII